MTDPAFGPVVAVCALEPGDTRVLAEAARLAGPAPLSALLPIGRPGHLGLLPVDPEEAEARLTADLAERLGESCDAALSRHISAHVRLGKPFLETIRHVAETGAGLLVKAAEDLDGLAAHLLASTDQHLLRKCPCPVLLLRPDAAVPPRRILATVDVDLSDADQPETQAALNRDIVLAAARLAAISGAEVEVLHAWEAPPEGMLWLFAEDRLAGQTYTMEIEGAAAGALRAFEAEVRGDLEAAGLVEVPVRFALRRGAPQRAIPEEVAAGDFDTLVIGTVARTGVQGLIIGNTAEDVLNSVDCSILALKPKGYRSPVL